MPRIITAEEFSTLFNVDTGVPVSLYVTSARNDVIRYAGAEAVADAEVDALATPADPIRANDLKLAAVYFALYHAYPIVNNRITQDGIVTTAREEGAAGGTILSYLKPADIQKGAQYLRERAFEVLAQYMVSGTPSVAQDWPESVSGTSRTVIR